MKTKHTKTPILDAMISTLEMQKVRFDVPGHHYGNGMDDLAALFKQYAMGVDLSAQATLDNLCYPESVINEAQQLAAEAFHTREAYFMVNGTSGAIFNMIFAAVKSGEKIIVPRNIHRSVINSIIISGAIPIYIPLTIHPTLHIPLGINYNKLQTIIEANPDAKAVLFNHATYYGICSDLKRLIELVHQHGMLALVDEAHGTHFYFDERLPAPAMALGADLSAISMHKTGGSLTQSSLLLSNGKIDRHYLHDIINLSLTTSASYILMASLDLARRNMVLHGKEYIDELLFNTNYARARIKKIGGYQVIGPELIDDESVFAYDLTKLSIITNHLGFSGHTLFKLLSEDYNIQPEFGDNNMLLLMPSFSNSKEEIDTLIDALDDIKDKYQTAPFGGIDTMIEPVVVFTPQTAFFAKGKKIAIKRSLGEISKETIMCYPPGIPIITAGEKITTEVLNLIEKVREHQGMIVGLHDQEFQIIEVMDFSQTRK